jgi:DNA polymerase III alpha subunit
LSTICPMVYDSKTKTRIAGMEMEDLETIGVVKFDILGVAMLDKIMFISDFLQKGVKDEIS